MEMKKRLLPAIYLLVLLLITACKKENTNATVNLPVVQGYLMPAEAVTVKLTQQKALTDTAKYGAAISGLKVYVSNGNTNVLLTETTAGTYTYTDTTFVVAGKTYTLKFNYLTYAVSAQTVVPPKLLTFATVHSAIDIPSSTSPNSGNTTLDLLTWDNPDSLNNVLVFNNLDGKAFPLNPYGANFSQNFEINTNRASYYNLTAATFPYYGHYQFILLSVNQAYIDVIKSNSNSTSQNLVNNPTNIVNGLGVFTAMQADTLSVLVE
jgi:hypothetical protein